MRAKSLVAATALIGATMMTGAANPAYAADKDPVDECQKDIALKISGQVNRAFLYADNGFVDDFFFVDNDNSSTRLRARALGRVNCDLKVGAQIEVQFESNTSSGIRFDQSGQGTAGANNFTERKLEIWFDSETWGRLWLGQGDTASNGTSEVDLSKTGVVAYSNIEDMAGGLEFENGERIRNVFDNMDGLSRTDRVRYDTPNLNGFRFSGSLTDDNEWDLAARFAQSFDGHKFAAAFSYVNGDTAQGFCCDYQLSGSASLLLSNGLNFTFAAGMQEGKGAGLTERDVHFYYGKVGWIFDVIDLGYTAASFDAAFNENVARQGDESWSYGAAVVQKIDVVGTELYFAVRVHELDHSAAVLVAGTNFTAIANDGPDNVVAVMTGARVKF